MAMMPSRCSNIWDDYPASVINEYLVMSLARSLGLSVPPVWRRYTPEPVYIIERFDRLPDSAGRTQRRHIIDACQLLNKSRSFKYTTATLQTLAETAVNALEQRIEHQNAHYSQRVHVFLGGDRRLVSTINHIIVPDMLERLSATR